MFLKLDYKKLGKFLKTKRIKSKMSQADAALSLKCHSQFISNIERGICLPPLKSLIILLTIYKVNQKEFIKRILTEEREILEKAFSGRRKRRGVG